MRPSSTAPRLQRTLNRETDGLVRSRFVISLTSLTTPRRPRYERPARPLPVPPGRNSDQLQRIMPGVEFRPQALIKGRRVGRLPRSFTPVVSEGSCPDFEGLVADLSSVLHAAERDHLRRRLPPGPDLFVRGTAAVLHRPIRRRLDPAARSAPGSMSMVSADRHALRVSRILSCSARRPSGRCADLPHPARHHLGLLGAASATASATKGASALGVSYLERDLDTLSCSADYDKLAHRLPAMTYGF